MELLNCYDEYVSGLSAQGKRWLDRAGPWRERLGIPNGLVMIEGQLAGHWRQTTSASQVTVDVVRLREFSGAERDGLDRHVTAYGGFLGLAPGVIVRSA